MPDNAFTAMPILRIRLSYNSSTADLLRYLRLGRDDLQIAVIVSELNRQGRLLLGPTFRLRFDETIPSRNIAERVFLKCSGLPTRSARH